MSSQRDGAGIRGPERGSELALSHSELYWDPSTLHPTPALLPEESSGKGHMPRLGQGPPTFSILASETSIKMLNFLTAARPFSRAMIHLSMFFPRGQDTQSIILVRAVTVTQGHGRPKSHSKGSPGAGRKVLTHTCTLGSVGTLLEDTTEPSRHPAQPERARCPPDPLTHCFSLQGTKGVPGLHPGAENSGSTKPTGNQGEPLLLSEPANGDNAPLLRTITLRQDSG